jgi:hypothetical protein
MFLKIGESANQGESRMLVGLIHCGRACCQHKAANGKAGTTGLEQQGKDGMDMRPANE